MQMQLPNGMQYNTVYALIQVTFEITSSYVIADGMLKFNNELFAICCPDLSLQFLLTAYVLSVINDYRRIIIIVEGQPVLLE